MAKRDKPFFLCIGAQKAGTTWLYTILQKHPELNLPPIKELHFFDELEEGVRLIDQIRGKKWGNKRWRVLFKKAIKEIWNKGSFKAQLWILSYLLIPRNKHFFWLYQRIVINGLSGEITPKYSILSLRTIEWIKKKIPNLKVILILRNPIEREWSELKMMQLDHKGRSEFEASDLHWLKKRAKKYNARGDYYRICKNWLQFFDREQVLITYYEDLARQPKVFIERVYDFLGVNPSVSNLELNQKVYLGHNSEIPRVVRQILEEKYRPLIQQIHHFLDFDDADYVSNWLRKQQ